MAVRRYGGAVRAGEKMLRIRYADKETIMRPLPDAWQGSRGSQLVSAAGLDWRMDELEALKAALQRTACPGWQAHPGR
jgi:hypothetical protein